MTKKLENKNQSNIIYIHSNQKIPRKNKNLNAEESRNDDPILKLARWCAVLTLIVSTLIIIKIATEKIRIKIVLSDDHSNVLNGSADYGGCNGDILTYPSNWPNSYYYTRYCKTHKGLTVATDGFASNEALERTAYILDNMMINMDSAIPDIMDRSGFRQIVMGSYPSEIVPNLPELSFLDPAIWGTRRGSGATVQIPVGTNAEEDVLCLDNDIYKDQDITVHEFAHSLHLLGFKQIWPEFQTELDQLYNYAYANSLWGWGYVGSYAMTNSEEYFAMGVQSYFDVQWPYDYDAPTNRDQLYQKDPNFAKFIDRWMYNNEWRGGCP